MERSMMESSHLSHSRIEEQENAYSYHHHNNNNNGTSKVVTVSLSISESQTWKRKTVVNTSASQSVASSMDLRSRCEEGVCLAGEGLTACSHAHRHRRAKTVTPPPVGSEAVHQTSHSNKTIDTNSTLSSSTKIHSIYENYLNQSAEEKDRSKTDYTYAHSYSYSPFVPTEERNSWSVPNMSRRSTAYYNNSAAFLNKDLMTQKTSSDYINESMSLNRNLSNNPSSTTTHSSSVRNGRRYSFTTDDEDDDETNSITKTTFPTLSSTQRKCLAWSAVFLFLPILLSSGAYWYMLSTGGTFGQTLHDMSSSASSRFASLWDSVSFGYKSQPETLSNIEDLTQSTFEIQSLRSEIEKMKAFQKATIEKQSADRELPPHSPPQPPPPSPNYDEILERLERLELQLTSCCKKNANLTQIIESEVKHIVDSRLNHFQTKYDNQLELEIDKAKTAILKLVREQATVYSLNKPNGAIDATDVETMIQNAITKYDADKTGEADYALESSGAWIINTRCSETYEVFSATYKLFGLTLWKSKTTPRTVIQSGVVPGECWCFKGSEGRIGIHLAARIIPTSFSYEHIPVSISRDGHIQSAPANFAVYGLKAEDDAEPALLGEYRYLIGENDLPLQRFEVVNTVTAQQTFKYIELVVKSNHGHPEYTCLYRFRVHGNPVFDEDA